MAPQAPAKNSQRLSANDSQNLRLPGNEPAAPGAARTSPPHVDASALQAAELAEDARTRAAVRFLHSFHVLLRASRLYQKNHPRVMESLEAAERNLRHALELLPCLAVTVEHGRLLLDVPGGASTEAPESNPGREWNALAQDLTRCGITSLIFQPQTNLGELNLLADLVNAALGNATRCAPSPNWPARLAEHDVTGIVANEPSERNVDTVLASLVATLVACGASAEQPAGGGSAPATSVSPEELTVALKLLGKLALLLEHTQPNSPQEAAQAFQSVLAEADRQAVSLLLAALVRETPREAEKPAPYLARLADTVILGSVTEAFCTGQLSAADLRRLLAKLAGVLASAASASQEAAKTGVSPVNTRPALTARWADEAYPEELYESFWAELPAREKARVLRGPEAWCVPVRSLRQYVEQLADNAPGGAGGASPREARLVLLNYGRSLESEEGRVRRSVAAGLAELYPLLERVWPHQLPEELIRGVVRALVAETSPGTAGLLVAVTENLARFCVGKGHYAGFERILDDLEQAPRGAEHAHLATLWSRLVADERWLLLVDAALGNRPLDPALPRLLRRDPERLLDRLGLLLTEPAGADILPAMARLLRAIGEPAFGALETRLAEPRRQRASTAVKLLAATEADRLVAALPRALPSWDWALQDLAVSELSRRTLPGTAWAFLSSVPEAHPLVVPMLLDYIGMAQEEAAVPLLLHIAAGEHSRLKDIFIRIKAVEALGRMRVEEASPLLRGILRMRNGLTYTEPAGLRAAAEEALALVEHRPSSARLRAAEEALERTGANFARPRRYLRIPLPSPFAAEIHGAHAGPARARTISLGGAFLESNRRLAVGDSVRVEIRAGLRRIQSSAVVRNVAPNGGGIEFVHMKQEDRERLRRLVRRLSSS